MDSRLKEILIKKITENIPSNIKPVKYLIDTLDLGRESAYRRLNGLIDFTFTEIVKLADELNFSLDELHCQYEEGLATCSIFDDKLSGNYSPGKSVENAFRYHKENMKGAFLEEGSYSIIVKNRLFGIFCLRQKYLTKFIYYKWIHQYDNVPLNFYYKDLTLPEEMLDLCKKTMYYQQGVDFTIILDTNTYHNTILEIKYYQERGLISEEEVLLIKNDLTELLEETMYALNTGTGTMGKNIKIYLSSMNIDTSSCFFKCGDRESCHFFMHSDNYINSDDPQLCKLQKEWLNSLMKYSTLITQSNQKMQAEFYNTITNQIKELA